MGTNTEVIRTMDSREMRRILASSFIGTMVEYYDFILYATCASIVFNQVFFAGLGSGFALFASFATLAVGYLLRPLGGIVFGHFGDKLGRKKMLVTTMMIMGIVTVAIGLLPTTAQIGIVAPIMLIVLRMMQGFAVGGEWGGAALMALEHAPQERRGFAASFANAGAPAGAISATLVLSLFTWIAGDQFLVWGWRVPFLFSAVLLVVGMVIRLQVSESPVFQALERKDTERRMPLGEVLRDHLPAVVLTMLAAVSFYVTQGVVTVWGVSVAVGAGEDQTTVLNWKAAGAVVTLVVTFVSARVSDRIGRRRMLTIAGITAMVGAVPLTLSLATGTVTGFAVAVVLGNGVIQGMLYGPVAAYIAERFPARVRYTGSSLAFQGASVLGAGFTPMIVTALALLPLGVWWVGLFWAGVAFIGILAVVLYRGTVYTDETVGTIAAEPALTRAEEPSRSVRT